MEILPSGVVVESVSIDALTIVSTREQHFVAESLVKQTGSSEGRTRLRDLATEIAMSEFVEKKKEPFADRDGRGWRRGSVIFVSSRDVAGNGGVLTKSRAKVAVTGYAAGLALASAVGWVLEEKVTRLDIAVDLAFPRALWQYPRVVYDGLPERVKKKCELRIKDTVTLYVGSRRSERYLRIYDASDKYELVKGSVFRFEVEIKKALANRVSTALIDKDNDSQALCLQVVKAMCDKNVIHFPFYGDGDTQVVRSGMIVEDGEIKLDWVLNTVVPAIGRALSDDEIGEIVRSRLEQLSIFDALYKSR